MENKTIIVEVDVKKELQLLVMTITGDMISYFTCEKTDNSYYRKLFSGTLKRKDNSNVVEDTLLECYGFHYPYMLIQNDIDIVLFDDICAI